MSNYRTEVNSGGTTSQPIYLDNKPVSTENSTAGNFLFSPYSLHSVFTQLLVGAGGSTAVQLERLLGLAGAGAAGSYRALTAGLQSGDSSR